MLQLLDFQRSRVASTA